ncbi:MAG: DUF116 domain-containing protein [Nanoarchaeota archaeon]
MKKIKFFLTISCYPIRKVLKLMGINYDVLSVINEYYKDRFDKLPNEKKAIFLPHCLRAADCPARLSSINGILCIKCGRCNCGKIKDIAEKKGYKFFIVPDVTFIKKITLRNKIQGILGVACEHDIKKAIKEEKIGMNGVKVKNAQIIPQGIKLTKHDCSGNTADWELIEKMIK